MMSLEQSLVQELYQTQENDDPFIIGDLSKITQRYNLWNKHLPDIEMFFAVKANDDPVVLEHIRSLGASFECASEDEIKYILEMGVSPNKIMMTSTQKFPSHIKSAKNMGVEMLAFDCEAELRKIKTFYDGNPKLIIRVSAPFESSSVVNMRNKFGCNEKDAKKHMQTARDLEMDVYGISFHVGHCTENPEPFVAAIEMAARLCKIGKEMGHSFELIDIGGGFPGPSGTEHIFIKIAEGICSAIQTNLPKEVRIVAEPGLFLVCDAFEMYMKVIGVRRRSLDKQDVFLNAGNNSCASRDNFEMHSSELHLLRNPLNRRRSSICLNMKKSNIWGPCSDPRDWLTEMTLPELRLGSQFKMTNVGGYTLNRSSNKFCGFPNPKVFYLMPKDSNEDEENNEIKAIDE